MNKLNRRNFIALTAAAPAIACPPRTRFAYVGSSAEIAVFSIGSENSWRPVQKLQSSRPAFLLLNRSGSVLFAANAIDNYEGLPRSTVESYNVDPVTGTLTLCSRQALSMSAIGARYLALSLDGGHLIVAAFGGGAYNVLPVSQDGAIQPPVHILKETGCSVHPEWQSCAHPHSLACHPDGHHLLASDFGRDRLSVFELDAGRIRRLSCCAVTPGDGPAAIAFADTGTGIVLLNRLHGSLSLRRFCPSSGAVSAEVARQSVDGAALLVAGDYAYVGGKQGITSWHIGQGFRLAGRYETNADASRSLVLTPDRDAIVSAGVDGCLSWRIDRNSGAVQNPSSVARVATPMSVAFCFEN